MFITEDIRYIGVDDHEIDLFEGIYDVRRNGMSYNSYLIVDDKIAVMDTVDARFSEQWLRNLKLALHGHAPEYLVVHHMEPDHSASIGAFLQAFGDATVVASSNAFKMMENYFGKDFALRRLVMKDGDVLDLGKHRLTFVGAPMVHWPEVLFSYDSTDKALFSADAFGKFGALDVQEEWTSEARRYYFGIVGSFGAQVQAALAKAGELDVRMVCPLHGPVLRENLGYYLELYNTWSSYDVESEGVAVCYTSVYGHMGQAVRLLAEKLREKGCPEVAVCDLARNDAAEALAGAFRYGKVVFATTTYNNAVFPTMRHFISDVVEHRFQNRTVGFMEGGTWAPKAASGMRAMLQDCPDLRFCETVAVVKGSLDDASRAQIDVLASQLLGQEPDPQMLVDAVAGATPKA